MGERWGSLRRAVVTAHPVIAERLVEQLDDLANLVANSDVETFADDTVHTAAQRLSEHLEDVLRSVEALRARRRMAAASAR
jgi:hypothetical protein